MSPGCHSGSSSSILDDIIIPLSNSLPSSPPSKSKIAPSSPQHDASTSRHSVHHWLPPRLHSPPSHLPLPMHIDHLKVFLPPHHAPLFAETELVILFLSPFLRILNFLEKSRCSPSVPPALFAPSRHWSAPASVHLLPHDFDHLVAVARSRAEQWSTPPALSGNSQCLFFSCGDRHLMRRAGRPGPCV